jgi:hypothetical protein
MQSHCRLNVTQATRSNSRCARKARRTRVAWLQFGRAAIYYYRGPGRRALMTAARSPNSQMSPLESDIETYIAASSKPYYRTLLIFFIGLTQPKDRRSSTAGCAHRCACLSGASRHEFDTEPRRSAILWKHTNLCAGSTTAGAMVMEQFRRVSRDRPSSITRARPSFPFRHRTSPTNVPVDSTDFC